MSFIHGRQVRHPVATASFRKFHTISLFVVATAAISLAVALRAAQGNAVREQITSLLGYEGRAVLEHFLAGFGAPLALAMFVLWMLLFPNRGQGPLCKVAGLGTLVAKVVKPVDVRMALCMTVFFSVLYVGYALGYEWLEATQSVYGGLPRGYFQWGQFGADIAGAVTSCYLVTLFGKTRTD